MKMENKMKLIFLSKSENESFARAAAGAFEYGGAGDPQGRPFFGICAAGPVFDAAHPGSEQKDKCAVCSAVGLGHRYAVRSD